MVYCALGWAGCSWADSPPDMVGKLSSYPHATSISSSESQVIDHEVGLGAMRKIRGVWQFKDSERRSGLLRRDTWQIVDGFSSVEVLEELAADLEAMEGSELLFSCEGRSCGQSVQWANRVFTERILYGREEIQRYRVYAVSEPVAYWVILYSAARTADRQYFHMESLRLSEAEQP